MDIIQYTPDILTPLTEFYNRLTAEVPFCYPVTQKEFALVMQNVDADEYNRSEGGLFGEKVYVAIFDDNVKAFIHIGISLKSENEEEDVGFIKFLGYERGERSDAQTLLGKAEEYLKSYNVTRIFAFSENDRYRFFHFEHAYLSTTLDHIHALLGFNGYQRSDGEVFLDWKDYTVIPNPSRIPMTLSVDWKQGEGQRPNCTVKAYKDNEEVGECWSVCGGEFSSHPDAQDWLHTVWLGIENDFQGQGLGKFLLQSTLQEMHKIGYRHAAISTDWENYRALLFYSNCGYKIVDWTYEYEKVLSKP
ncbi:GNAT family N-acetyltransferase [Candidatus Poribacteria bacterium]|nr:GNAT family N-acetyltransferase [Candidatus Poribacteria bacterium]